jgi:hypothetical protein
VEVRSKQTLKMLNFHSIADLSRMIACFVVGCFKVMNFTCSVEIELEFVYFEV